MGPFPERNWLIWILLRTMNSLQQHETNPSQIINSKKESAHSLISTIEYGTPGPGIRCRGNPCLNRKCSLKEIVDSFPDILHRS